MTKWYQIGRAMILGAGMAMAAHGASAQTVIKLAHDNVPDHPMGKGFTFFKEYLEEKSGGEFRVDIFDSSKFGNFDSVVQGLQSGLLQMGSSSTPNLSPFSPDFMIFDMPYLFPSYEAADLITDGPVGQKAAQALAPTGIIGLGYIDIGFRHIFNNQRKIENVADAAGLKIRSTPSKVHISTLKAFGTNPTPIGWSEVYTALQQKTVDGIDIDLNLAWFNNFHEVNQNLTLTGSTYSPHLVMASQIFMDSLSPENQALIVEAFEKSKIFERELIRSNEKEIIDNMRNAGVTVVELTAEQQDEWKAATAPIYAEFEEKVGKDLIEQVRQTIAEHTAN